jgi:hypothetical protein
LCKAGAGFFVCNKAEKRRNTLCISSFDNEVAGEKDKPECTGYFGTVPQYPDYRMAKSIESPMDLAARRQVRAF